MSQPSKARLRSQAWFDNPDNPAMTAFFEKRKPDFSRF